MHRVEHLATFIHFCTCTLTTYMYVYPLGQNISNFFISGGISIHTSLILSRKSLLYIVRPQEPRGLAISHMSVCVRERKVSTLIRAHQLGRLGGHRQRHWLFHEVLGPFCPVRPAQLVQWLLSV